MKFNRIVLEKDFKIKASSPIRIKKIAAATSRKPQKSEKPFSNINLLTFLQKVYSFLLLEILFIFFFLTSFNKYLN